MLGRLLALNQVRLTTSVDNPHATKLLVHLLAAFAEHKRNQVSARTIAALAAAKARGVRLGNPKGAEATLEACAVMKAATAPARALALPHARSLRDNGAPLRPIAAALKAEGVPTLCDGSAWGPSSVRLLLKTQDAPPISTLS